MKVRELIEGAEYVCDDEGEFIKCPVCHSVWMTDIEGEVDHGSCKHLRFVFSVEGGFDIFNEWDSQDYIEQFDKEMAKYLEEFSLDYCDFFEKLSSSGLDEIVYHGWDDSPFTYNEMYWGYQKD